MKNIILLILALAIVSCKKEIQKEEVKTSLVKETGTKEIDAVQKVRDTITITEVPTSKISKEDNPMIPFKKRVFKEDSDHKSLLGYYVGFFNALDYGDAYNKKGSYSNKINISIDHIKNDSLFGHSVVAGNARLFKGLFDSKALFAKVLEPGDDKYDGGFEFSFITEKQLKIQGIWIANNSNLAVPKRKYKLNNRAFIYNPELNLNLEYHELNISVTNSQFDGGKLEAIRPESIAKLNASIQELTNQDIENLSKGELEVLRNFIYARHGYSFKNRKMRYFFDSNIDWYIPVSTDVRSQLTDLEKKNIDLIKRYEQHAERYYDYFGR